MQSSPAKKKPIVTSTAVVGGQKIKVALPEDVKKSSEEVIKKYADALDYLKDK